MTGVNSTRVVKALLTAAALLALTLFAAANFVLVDVRLPGGVVRVRLAWVAVVPSLCAFAVGLASARLQERAASRSACRRSRWRFARSSAGGASGRKGAPKDFVGRV